MLLSDSFKEQIYSLFRYLPHDVQCALSLFSPTMPFDVLKAAKMFMRDPVRIFMRDTEPCKGTSWWRLWG